MWAKIAEGHVLGGIITWRGHGLQASHTAVKSISGRKKH